MRSGTHEASFIFSKLTSLLLAKDTTSEEMLFSDSTSSEIAATSGPDK